MNKCSKCDVEVLRFVKGSRRCQSCRSASLRDYCKRTGYHGKRYARVKKEERERHLIRKYGVSLADYDRMFAEQDGQCAICSRTQKRAFDVDHSHATGIVRGLLCTSCNRMVGHAHDDASRLRKAADYLEAVPQVAAEVIRAYMCSI